MHIHTVTLSPIELCCPLKVTVKSLPTVFLFIDNMKDLDLPFKQYCKTVRFQKDHRHGWSPFREDGEFVQEIVSIPVHYLTLPSDNKNIMNQIVGELARKTGFYLS